jgi:hypothetical protein
MAAPASSCPDHLGLTGVDGNWHRGATGEFRHDRHDATNLLLRVDLGSPRSGGLPPDIDDARSVLDHLERTGDCSIERAVAATVRERIRGDIQNAHDDGRAEIE